MSSAKCLIKTSLTVATKMDHETDVRQRKLKGHAGTLSCPKNTGASNSTIAMSHILVETAIDLLPFLSLCKANIFKEVSIDEVIPPTPVRVEFFVRKVPEDTVQIYGTNRAHLTCAAPDVNQGVARSRESCNDQGPIPALSFSDSKAHVDIELSNSSVDMAINVSWSKSLNTNNLVFIPMSLPLDLQRERSGRCQCTDELVVYSISDDLAIITNPRARLEKNARQARFSFRWVGEKSELSTGRMKMDERVGAPQLIMSGGGWKDKPGTCEMKEKRASQQGLLASCMPCPRILRMKWDV
ncbi:hypothetical protein BKA70DRAFT_1243793 [Coprinopsis sp. MPI-PUGE-AT-0042]|nr:hypothetical protein BKA70DRAFT_1243793 [Coprinopsis sp. MPI-PUGE-AT-0042]